MPELECKVCTVGLASPYLKVVLLARRPHHVPLAARLLGYPMVDTTAEATTDLIVRVLRYVFRQVAGALAPCDHGDHPGVWWCCLGRADCRGSRDHEVAWWGGGGVRGEGESGKGQGGDAPTTCAGGVVQLLQGTEGVEVFHGAVDGSVHC